ncbi:MAG: acyl-CoA dehydrogenase family protein, partial [Pseudomonadota bacterium]
MDFGLSSEQELVFQTALEFGQREIAPHTYAWEREGTIPRTVLRQAGGLGFGSLCVPAEQGGAGLTRLDAMFVYEALSAACPSVAAFLSIHNMCVTMVAKYGTADLIERCLPPLLSLDAVASYCLTEPNCGSDAAALRTRAE